MRNIYGLNSASKKLDVSYIKLISNYRPTLILKKRLKFNFLLRIYPFHIGAKYIKTIKFYLETKDGITQSFFENRL